MRLILATLLAFAAFVSATVESANADPYRWCAHYSGELSASNCWFMTIEQCRATVSGVGGYCGPNPFYDGRPIGQEQRAPRRRP
jgi:hypothetical protein